jgi:DNA-binding GntR family transcriptional regulator
MREGWQSVPRRSLADEATGRLRDLILAGRLLPGDRLGEAEVSSRLRVSRGPVREALVRLEQEGLVGSQWHKGAVVTDLTRSDIIELGTLRTALETLAMARACQSATQQDLDGLGGVVARMRAASVGRGTGEVLARLDIEFHDAVYRAAHHERLYAAWTTIRSQVALALLRRRVVNPDYAGLVAVDHAELAELIIRRDADAAQAQIAAHIEGARTRLLAAYDDLAGPVLDAQAPLAAGPGSAPRRRGRAAGRYAGARNAVQAAAR